MISKNVDIAILHLHESNVEMIDNIKQSDRIAYRRRHEAGGLGRFMDAIVRGVPGATQEKIG